MNVSVLALALNRPALCGPAVKDSGVTLQLPTAALVVSNAEPVRVGLETVTEFAQLPELVTLCALGSKVICAAEAPDAHRGGPMASTMTARNLRIDGDSSFAMVDYAVQGKLRAIGKETLNLMAYKLSQGAPG